MSIEAYTAVWNHSQQTGGLRLTLLALADYASRANNYTCEASIATLANKVKVSQRQMTRNIKALEDAGEVAVFEQRGRGNTNIVSLSPLMVKVTCVSGFGEDNMTSTSPNAELENLTSETEKVTPVTQNLTSEAVKPDTDVTRTVNKPKEPKEPKNNNAKSNREEIQKVLDSFGEIVNGKKTPRYTDGREKVIGKLLKDKFFREHYRMVFEKYNDSDFLMGRSGKFTADFDWIFKKRQGEVNPNWQIILDGRYDNKPQQQKQPTNGRNGSHSPRPATNPQYKRPVGAHT